MGRANWLSDIRDIKINDILENNLDYIREY
jgi:hypothetical protein